MTALNTQTADLPLSEVIGLSDDPIAVFDRDAQLVAANPALVDAFRPLAAFLQPGTHWDVLVLEAVRQQVLTDEVAQQLRLVEERHIDKPDMHPEVTGPVSGETRYSFRLSATSDGGFALMLRAAGDPDNALASEREVELLMAKVLEACPTCLTMARIGDGQILYRSPAATELLGKGRNSKDHFAHREDRADFITALLPGSRVDDMRFDALRPDGSTFPASISARLIDYRGEDVIVSSIFDLSDDLALQDQLARQKEQVFQAEKMSALGELLAGVAHELNNPLSIVVGNAHILLEEDLDADLLRRVSKLSDAAERCVRIVRTFLSMARERPMDLAPVAIPDLIDAAVGAFRAGAHETRTEIRIGVGTGLPDLMIDEVQMVQVLSNLLTNADHAIADSDRAGTIDIGARPGPRPGLVRLELADNGPGVPVDIAGRIFDPLFTTKAGGKGTGVGLALCHRIVAAHGGKIALMTRAPDGARFVIDLPAAPEDGGQAS